MFVPHCQACRLALPLAPSSLSTPDPTSTSVSLVSPTSVNTWGDFAQRFLSSKMCPEVSVARLKALAKRQPQHLVMALEGMTMEEKRLLKQPLFSMGISACGRCQLWQEAVVLFRMMVDVDLFPDLISYSSLISSLEKGGQWKQAVHAFTSMLQVGIQVDVIIFSALMSACATSGQWSWALHFFHFMCQLHVTPNVVSYSAMISSFEKASQWQLGLEFFQMATPTDPTDTCTTSEIIPDVICYSAAISLCEKAGKWQFALLVLLGANWVSNWRWYIMLLCLSIGFWWFQSFLHIYRSLCFILFPPGLVHRAAKSLFFGMDHNGSYNLLLRSKTSAKVGQDAKHEDVSECGDL